MKFFPGTGARYFKVVLSLCDYSGNWPRPWHEAGYSVVCFDLKHGDDLLDLTPQMIWLRAGRAVGNPDFVVPAVLAAPLCTAFTSSASQHWPRHEVDGTTEECRQLADSCIDVVEYFNPPTWALENPRGRIEQLVPRLAGMKRFEFNPCDFAGWLPPDYLDVSPDDPVETVMASNRYTKRTGIWGRCKVPERRHVDPIVYETSTGKRGGVIWAKLGGKSERTKEIRSRTPMGFARAFYSANGCG
jgi:hypothetical protein